ncbi:PRC-barrel domain-containing protein [Blastopirellula marina]|uniref:PRC-barrel domain-containing protein n=1 Tax=Blastopirellula marina TaxID=124 RepID=A0A2S8FHC2_9BACT|nr:PRC-barrel domain-containing protein [Blastopirellula marina]PQO31588.1 hypothetical protein C5Y98_19420 [Blastopirellula marina]PTL42895.1 PRC-barrel domain containing protein [Blastopirellula marina]
MLRKIPAVAAAALMAAGCVTSLAHADDIPSKDDSNVQVDVRKPVVSDRLNAEVRTSDQASTTTLARRASNIQGMSIQNEAGKDLGAVRDVVIDTDRAQVKYVAVSYGGFLGLGSKLYAVPFEAFQFRPATQGKEAVLLLNLDEQTLRKAPSFDSDNWPDMASPAFSSAIHKHYGERDRGLNIQAGPVGVNIDLGRKAPAEERPNPLAVQRTDNLIGMKVVNKADEKVGTINDLMIDMSNGHVRYAALSVGGLAGVGDSLYAVAWDNFGWKHNAQEDTNELVLNVDPDLLKDVKGFDQENWPQQANAHLGTTSRVDDQRPGVDADINVPGVSVDVDTKDN